MRERERERDRYKGAINTLPLMQIAVYIQAITSNLITCLAG